MVVSIACKATGYRRERAYGLGTTDGEPASMLSAVTTGPGGAAVSVGFGPTVLWRDQGNGKFFCPACGTERDYVHRQSRRWFQFIFPIVPRDILDDLYCCQTCHREFDEHVLTSPPTSGLSTRLQHTARAASVLAMLDGDPYHEASRTRAVDVVRGVGLRQYSSTDLDADLRSMDVSRVFDEAAQLTIDLDMIGREKLLMDIGYVALASGSLTPKNRSMLDQLGRALRIAPGSVHKMLTQLDQDAANRAAFRPREG